MLSEKLILL